MEEFGPLPEDGSLVWQNLAISIILSSRVIGSGPVAVA
jgi:hypothetical protein